MVAFLFRGEGKWGVQRTLHQFSHHQVRSISAAKAAHMDFDLCGQVSGLTDFTNLRQESLFQFGVPCWLADQDGKPGDKLRAEIYQAIR